MSLLRIAESCYYLPGRVNLGLLLGTGEAAFIDTGLDEGSARKALHAVQDARARVVAIVNTHHHADHCGGNAFLRRRTQAPIYAPPVEAALVENTAFEPFFLYGAAPFPAIDSKWFHAAPSKVEHLLEGTLSLCGLTIRVVPVPGHSINMAALDCGEVAYLADALMAPEVLERYPIQYCYDVRAYRQTLETLSRLRNTWYVGAHFPATQDLDSLLAANRRNLEQTAEAVLDAASHSSTEEIVARVCDLLKVSPLDGPGYLLASSAVKAHLSAHVHEGRAAFDVRDQRPVWRRMS